MSGMRRKMELIKKISDFKDLLQNVVTMLQYYPNDVILSPIRENLEWSVKQMEASLVSIEKTEK